jgi:monoamine oxidase
LQDLLHRVRLHAGVRRSGIAFAGQASMVEDTHDGADEHIDSRLTTSAVRRSRVACVTKGRDGGPSATTGTTRRRFIGAAAVAGAGAALPSAADAAKVGRPVTADVCIVGAGLAGLSAAKTVVAAGKSCVVVEARGRVGGRTLNRSIGNGEIVEVGGQWVGPTQDTVLALIRELGLQTFKTYNDGDYIFHRNGSNARYTASGPLGAVPPDIGSVEAFAALSQLDAMAAEVPRDAPWTAARAAEWDSQTFETWKLANTATDGARLLLDLGIEAVWAAEPRDVSLLHVLFYIACAGNASNPGTFERLINTAGGAQESRVVGGSQRISIELAKRLGRRIWLNAPVRRIAQDAGGATVETAGRLRVRAKQVIVTVPPSIIPTIIFDPMLSAQKAQLVQRFPMGSVFKCEAVYDKPFWRDEGLAGQVTSDREPVRIMFDNSPPDGSPGVLLGFIEGQAARRWSERTAADRRAAVLGCFAAYFGERARNPSQYVEISWANELYTRGCYTGYTPPGVLLDYGDSIRRPHGRIHWAGTETATFWNGYMDGALTSGQRAAREALSA